MKIYESENKENFAAVRSKISSPEQLQAWDNFWSEVKVFDSSKDEHVAQARACCGSSGGTFTIGIKIHF